MDLYNKLDRAIFCLPRYLARVGPLCYSIISDLTICLTIQFVKLLNTLQVDLNAELRISFKICITFDTITCLVWKKSEDHESIQGIFLINNFTPTELLVYMNKNQNWALFIWFCQSNFCNSKTLNLCLVFPSWDQVTYMRNYGNFTCFAYSVSWDHSSFYNLVLVNLY